MADGAVLRESLPTRRTETWRYSDLRAALAALDLRERDQVSGITPHAVEHGVIARLARDAANLTQITLEPGQQRELIERIDGTGLAPSFLEVNVGEGAAFTRIVFQA